MGWSTCVHLCVLDVIVTAISATKEEKSCALKKQLLLFQFNLSSCDWHIFTDCWPWQFKWHTDAACPGTVWVGSCRADSVFNHQLYLLQRPDKSKDKIHLSVVLICCQSKTGRLCLSLLYPCNLFCLYYISNWNHLFALLFLTLSTYLFFPFLSDFSFFSLFLLLSILQYSFL